MKPHFFIIALALVSFDSHAALNKWVDADGTVHYSDIVPPEVKSSQTVRNISGKGQPEAPVSTSPKSYVEREAEMKKSKQEKDETTQKQAQKDADAEAKKRNCEAAQQNVRALEDGARIATYDAKGERSYVDDATRAQRLEEARKAVSTSCT